MARIDTGGTMSGRPCFDGTVNNGLSGYADYGNTSANWNTSNTNKLYYSSGHDPSVEVVRWGSCSRYSGWMNTKLGVSSGRYMTGEWISGCEFQWRTYPNESGGIALRRWGIGIINSSGTRKRWSSEEVNQWSTDSSWKTIGYNFGGSLASQLNSGWRFEQLHFMIYTPSHGSTPKNECILDIKNFKYRYKNNNAIVPAMRTNSSRESYPIA